jgi:hypothetical protein
LHPLTTDADSTLLGKGGAAWTITVGFLMLLVGLLLIPNQALARQWLHIPRRCSDMINLILGVES